MNETAFNTQNTPATTTGGHRYAKKVPTAHSFDRREMNGPGGKFSGGLSTKEADVLAMLFSYTRDEDIADALGISPNAVKAHTDSIYRKLNINDQFQAVLWASQNL